MSTPSDTNDGWQGILAPGEMIRWQGRPDGAIVWTAFETRRTLFGLAMMGFAAFWTSAALTSAPAGAPRVILSLFGLFFFALGARHAGGHVIWDAYRRRRSWYTLTDRRAIIATALFGRKQMKSYPITPHSSLTLTRTDPADLWFATLHRRTKQGSRTERVGFERLQDARMVYDLMRKIQRSTGDGP